MIREIVTYGHPSLRARGIEIRLVDAKVRRAAADMLETMAAADGVGLAAQQVGLPWRMFVLDVRGVADRPSWMWVDGREVDPASRMPMVLLNPMIELSGKPDAGLEGCLSFPGLSAPITRPSKVRVHAQGLDGEIIHFEAAGLLARAVQHEYDHIEGVLFIDRMAARDRRRLHEALEALLQRAKQGGGPVAF